jgi:hypothetical protein
MEHALTVHVESWQKWFEYGKKIRGKDVKMGLPQERLPNGKMKSLLLVLACKLRSKSVAAHTNCK